MAGAARHRAPPSFADDRVHVPRHAHLTFRFRSPCARTVPLAMRRTDRRCAGDSRPTSARPRGRARPAVRPRDGCVFVGGRSARSSARRVRPDRRTLTGRPSAIQHGEGEHEEAPDQERDHPGPGGHAVVARSGARDRGIQIRRPRDGLLAQGRSGAQQQGFAVVPPWW